MSCIFVRKFSCDKDDGPNIDLTSTLSATNDSTDPKGEGNREKIDALEIKTLVYPGERITPGHRPFSLAIGTRNVARFNNDSLIVTHARFASPYFSPFMVQKDGSFGNG